MGAVCVNFLISCTKVTKRHFCVVGGRCSIHQINCFATCCVCSIGDSVGS